MWMEQEDEWDRIVKVVPKKKIVEFVSELHGPIEYRWIDDAERLPLLSFMDGTHCCTISLTDPPNWLMFEIMKYYRAVSDIVEFSPTETQALREWLASPNGASPRITNRMGTSAWLEAVENGGIWIRTSKHHEQLHTQTD